MQVFCKDRKGFTIIPLSYSIIEAQRVEYILTLIAEYTVHCTDMHADIIKSVNQAYQVVKSRMTITILLDQPLDKLQTYNKKLTSHALSFFYTIYYLG